MPSYVPQRNFPKLTKLHPAKPNANFCSDTMTRQRAKYIPHHVQMPFPMIRPGEITVGGERMHADMLFHGVMPMINDDVRRDVAKATPFRVDRIGLQKSPEGVWSGVLEAAGVPYLFAFSSTSGFKLRHAVDAARAREALDTLIDAERRESVEIRRQQASQVVIKAGKPHHVGYKRRDPRTGKEEMISPLGYNPEKPAVRDFKPIVVPPSAKRIEMNGHHVLDEDDEHGIDAYKHIVRSKAKTRAQVIAAVREYVDENFEGSPKVLNQIHDAIMKELFDKGALSERSADEDDQPTWSKRIAKHKPEMPKVFDAKGTKLIVGGKAVTVSPEVEQACYTYAKRFLFRNGEVANQAKWTKNFEASIRKLGKLPPGEINYKYFLSRIRDDDAKSEKKDRKKPVVETPKTHPHLFIEEDGVSTRVLAAGIPCGGFYTGKKNYGAWVPPLREEDLEINVSKGGVPPGWKGKVISDPTKEYYLSWRNPVSGKKGYGFLSRKEADLHKFHGAAVLGEQMQKIHDQLYRDITESKDPAEKAAAICVMLIDRHHFRSGDESYAKEGTYGIASFRRKHVKIDGTKVTFSFIGKKQEPWTRTVDFAGMPSALNFIQKCVKGKGPDDRLWQGEGWKITAADVNDYLEPFSKNGVTITSKSFRTFHANRYMNEYIGRVEKLSGQYNLTDAEIKKLYKGVPPKDSLLKRKAGGTSLADALGLVLYEGAKGKGKKLMGLLPSVAAKLGHTTGSSRGSYVDPVVVTNFAKRHGWDERLPKEKKTREDLPGYNPEDQD